MKKRMKKTANLIIKFLSSSVQKTPDIISARNIDSFIQSLLFQMEGKETLNNPEFFIGMLRDSFMPYSENVIELKRSQRSDDEHELRFARLVESFKSSIPPLRTSTALEIARIADDYMGNTEYQKQWGADIAWHFHVSSSFSSKGRLLDSVIRFMRPQNCVEAGTAYGMSAMYVLSALEKYCKGGRLYTIEGYEPQYSLSSSLLSSRFGETLKCYKGLAQETLESVSNDIETIDLFVHDAGHSRNDYVNDFNSVSGSLTSGSVILFDDIRWSDARFAPEEPMCYKGWQEVVEHPRVCNAIEVGQNIGIIQLS